MGSPNRQEVDFYVDLILELLKDDPLQLCSRKHSLRDAATIRDRTANEGLSFLTKTLPTLGKALLVGLETMRFQRPREFQGSRKGDSRPAFMQVYFNRIFCADGALLDSADPKAVSHVLQVCMLGYKLELPYSEDERAGVIQNFMSTDQELENLDFAQCDSLIAAASYVAREVLVDFDHKAIIPRHGPGAVATGEKLEDKWVFSRLYGQIHQVYPYYDYFIVGRGRELVDRLGWYKSLERIQSGCAKVVLVPKDSRGPRLISCEPLEYQWIQQGLGRALMQHIESHKWTRGRVNFTHQTVNRQLALDSSKDREYATLDLKDASDRVSLALVRRVFQHNAGFLRALEATRSTATLLPNGEVRTLSKFAPMGSALCFPVEALVFWCLIVAAIHRETGKQPAEIGRQVFVYGDDIVVKSEYVDLATSALESCGLRVNRAKCYVNGYFRESCGMDAFHGVQVTPARLRTRFDVKSSSSAAVYASYVSLLNQMRRKGYERVAQFLEVRLRKLFGVIPYSLADSAFPGIECNEFVSVVRRNIEQGVRTRYNESLQRPEFYVPTVHTAKRGTRLFEWPRLLRDLVTPGVRDPDETVLARSVTLKRAWRAA